MNKLLIDLINKMPLKMIGCIGTLANMFGKALIINNGQITEIGGFEHE